MTDFASSIDYIMSILNQMCMGRIGINANVMTTIFLIIFTAFNTCLISACNRSQIYQPHLTKRFPFQFRTGFIHRFLYFFRPSIGFFCNPLCIAVQFRLKYITHLQPPASA